VYGCPGNKDIKDKANCTYSFIKDNKHCFPESGKTFDFGCGHWQHAMVVKELRFRNDFVFSQLLR
jgi:hypothetical protein